MADSKPNPETNPLRAAVLTTAIFQRPGTLLLIDPDAAFRAVFKQKLESMNHTVIETADGGSTLKLAESDPPDLIVVDVDTADMDGFEICRRFKNHHGLRDTPVIMTARGGRPEAHVRAMECGANDFHAKPLDWTIFGARVASLLKYRRAVAALRNARADLEVLVRERTAELVAANERLKNEIVDRQRAQDSLRVSEERYALAAAGAHDGLWDWNLETQEIYYSPRWIAMIGRESSEIKALPDEWFRRVHVDDLGMLKATFDAHVRAETEHLQMEYRMLYKDGTYRWMLVRGMAVRDATGRAVRVAGSQTDITVRKMAELQLVHNAFHDELTGLPNRALFMDRLGHAMQRMQGKDVWNIAVFLLDIDRFKIINDSLGHNTGNHLLVEFGRRLRKSLRFGDTVARLGGDEFAVLLEYIDRTEAHALAEKIHAGLKEPIKLREREVFVTTSVGILMGKKKYERPEDLLRDAETAMHRAKTQGKARAETFQSGMHAQVVNVLHLENDLRRAVENNEFVLHYQPIVALDSGELSGFEALIRWNHPERGMVPPGEFIPLAEETELITPITLWVLKEACQTLKTWRERLGPRLTMSVNLSGRTCSQAGALNYIAEIIRASGIDPLNLKFEITEGAIMEHARSATDALEKLKAMKVQLLIDDFGTGYSSLSYLHRLPIDVLKIDRTFVSNMELEPKNWEIVRTIVALAGSLNMKVIAEGVETERQLALLRELKCEFAQGYFFAKPLNMEKAEQLLAAGGRF